MAVVSSIVSEIRDLIALMRGDLAFRSPRRERNTGFRHIVVGRVPGVIRRGRRMDDASSDSFVRVTGS